MKRSGLVMAAVGILGLWIAPAPSALARDNAEGSQCHTTAGGGLQCCGDNASWVEGSGPGFSDGWACMCNAGYQVEERGDTTICGIAIGGGGGGGGGGGDEPGGGGGGGSGPDCKTARFVPVASGRGLTFTLYSGPARPDCPDTKPPRPCADCVQDRKDATAAAAADFNDCVRGWGVDTAVAACVDGYTRAAWSEDLNNAVNNNNNSGTYCYPVPLGGRPVCVYVEGFEACLAGWLYGNNATGHSVSESTSMAGSVGVKMGGGGNEITGGISFNDVSGQTGTVSMGPETGLFDVCKSFKGADDAAVLAAYKACSKTATDGVKGSCSGSTANGGNTN